MHPIYPKLLSGPARRTEIAQILAAGVLRLRTRQATQTKRKNTPTTTGLSGPGTHSCVSIKR